ncbi:MAG: glycosyltransferase family 39 protein [Chloroflexi bacterium]|nr:glycosyltransferase family 39 protein [Chloroflexota bacterium]
MSNPLWLGLAILLGCFIPGCLLTALWNKDWMRDLTFSECLFVQLLLGVILNSWLMLLLAELEIFRLSAILLSWVLVCVSLAWVGRQHLQRVLSWLRPSWQDIELIILLLLAGLLFAHPAEAMLVFDDSGIYFLGGVELAKTGSLIVREPFLASLSPEQEQQLLFTGLGILSRYWGQFFIWGWSHKWIVFGLLHLQRLWCGLFTLFLGTYGGLWVAPAFGVLAIAGLYFVGRRLFAREVGLLAAVLLTLNFAQIWHARLPLSESLTQALLIGGFYLLTLFLQKKHVWLGFWAGACLGTLFLARIDAAVAELLLVALIVYWKWSGRWRPEYSGFAVALIATLAYATLHNVLMCWPYLILQWQISGSPALVKGVILASLSGGIVVLIGWLKPQLMRAFLDWVWVHIWGILAVAFSIWMLWIGLSYFVSGKGGASPVITWLMHYWTPLGMLFAIAALGLLFIRRPPRKVLPTLAVGLAYLGAFSLNPMVNPIQPWAMRRFMPAVMPVMALLIAYGVMTLPLGHKLLRYAMQAIVVSTVIWALLRMDLPLLKHTEYRGVSQQIAQLAKQFEKDAVLLFDRGAPTQHITQPLAYLHDLCSFVLQKTSPDSTSLDPLIENWLRQGRPVYLVLTGGTLDWHPDKWTFQPKGVFDLRFTRIQRSIDTLPSAFEDSVFRLDIYQILPSLVEPLDQRAAFLLNMEAGEYSYLKGGFYGLEIAADGLTYRWTNGLGRIQLPGRANSDALLRLRVAGGRPGKETPISVAVNGVVVATDSLPIGFVYKTLEITVPASVLNSDSQGVVIEILSDTWIPHEAGYVGDTRELGVLVDWLEWSLQDRH